MKSRLFIINPLPAFKVLAYFLSFLALFASCGTLKAANPPPSEISYKKAILLIKSLKFINWPEPAFRDFEQPIVIGIFGEDDLANALEKLILTHRVNGRTIRLIQSYELVNLIDANLIFISESEKTHASSVIDFLENYPILTIGESKTFLEDGGMIAFLESQNKVEFGINFTATKKANFDISSKFLKLAKFVKQDKS